MSKKTFEELFTELQQKAAHGDPATSRTAELVGKGVHAIGKKVDGVWVPHKPSEADYEAAAEPHARGAVLVAAVFDAFLTIYRRRKGRRLASSRSTRPWRAGHNRRVAPAPGPTYRPNASNMCGGSRS